MDNKDRSLPVGKSKNQLHPDIIDRERKRLMQFYKLKLDRGVTSPTIQNEEDIINSVDGSISTAVKGYPKAPIRDTHEFSLVVRLKVMTRYHLEPSIWTKEEREQFFSTKSPYGKIKLPSRLSGDSTNAKSNQYPDLIENPFKGEFLEFFNADEKEFYDKRKEAYIEDFDFNLSSDGIMLESLLADEMLLRRLQTQVLVGSSKSGVQKEIESLQKRILESQKSLGVTRAQRVNDNRGEKGTVASLAENIDAKIVEISRLKDVELRKRLIDAILENYSLVTADDLYRLAEELQYTRERALRAEIRATNPISTRNELPDLDKLVVKEV